MKLFQNRKIPYGCFLSCKYSYYVIHMDFEIGGKYRLKKLGERLFLILYISVASFCKFRSWIVNVFSMFRRFSNEEV